MTAINAFGAWDSETYCKATLCKQGTTKTKCGRCMPQSLRQIAVDTTTIAPKHLMRLPDSVLT
eukprot:5456188-Amphidinium_carterae.1